MKRFLIFVIVVILALFAISHWNQQRRVPDTFTPATAPKIDLKDTQVLAALDAEYTNLVHAVVPSVVSVLTSRKVETPQMIDPFELFFGRRFRRLPQEQIQNSLGSGVIVSKEGHILTNNHVVANMDEVNVQLADGRKFPAKVIGTDEQTDIAVLKIDATGITPLVIGDSDNVKPGSIVFAIGNPFGLQETVTQGIISATGRQVSDESGNEFFQTDTAINPGNSGGPLVNLRGEIIGINSAIGNYSGSGTWQGVGFAIPSNVARRAMESIIKTGHVVRGYLGVIIQELTPELADQFGVPNQTGVLISGVTPGSPAQKAGLQKGDIVTAFNGKPVKSIRDLLRQVSSVPVGSQAEIQILRNKQEQKITATIQEMPANYGTSQALPQQQQSPQQPGVSEENPLAGVDVTEIPSGARSQLPENVKGVMVAQVDPNSPAASALQPGDVIEEIARQPVDSVADFSRIARSLPAGRRVMLSICRGKLRSFVLISPR